MGRELRRADWAVHLRAYLRQVRRAPFSWRDHYCALFAADAVLAMTGVDHAAAYRGAGDAQAGLAALQADGFADHVDFAAHVLAEVAPSEARAGDVAAVPVADGLGLGIVQGDWVYLVGPAGLREVRRDQIKRAFRV